MVTKKISVCLAEKCRGRDRCSGRNTKGIGKKFNVLSDVFVILMVMMFVVSQTSQICILKYMQFMSVILQESC